MSQRTDVDALAQLPGDEFEERIRAAAERIELRANRCLAENRDLTERERQLCTADRDELHALHKAEAIREHAERTRKAIGEAIENTPRPETRGCLAEFAEALSRGVPYRVQVECRSITSANAGARGAVAVEQLGRPQWLYQAAAKCFRSRTSGLRPCSLRRIRMCLR